VTGVDPQLFDNDPPAVTALLTSVFRRETSVYWLQVLRAGGVHADRARHFEEMIFDTHVEAEGLVTDLEHPAVGKYRALGVPIRFGATPMRARRSSPAFSEHTTSILAKLGFAEREVQGLLESGTIPCVGERHAIQVSTDRNS
jgi:CoA:oxalate CoA-transferase